MSDKLQKLVVRLMPHHPTGKRNRAGFSFSTKPCAIEVTGEQKKAIEEDKYIKILTKGTAFKQGLENPKTKQTEEEKKEDIENAKEEAKKKPFQKMNKVELIQELEAKGQLAGKDFDPLATNAALIELLSCDN